MWRDGYLGSSIFVSKLLENVLNEKSSRTNTLNPQVLIAGCGDTQPYVFRMIEPFSTHLTYLDLSSNNLKRAKLRLFPWFKNTSFKQGFIEKLKVKEKYDHIDAFGVLHHLEDPELGLKKLFNSLKPGGTMRVMVYNSQGRSWIHSWQDEFKKQRLSLYDKKDLRTAKNLMKEASNTDKTLFKYLRQIKPAFTHNSRFVDTFFHSQECREGLDFWMNILNKIGLINFALFDRYCELDKLKNTMKAFPSYKNLSSMISDGKFQANFEIYLFKPSEKNNSILKNKVRLKDPYFFKGPNFWQNYSELKKLSHIKKCYLWQYFLNWCSKDKPKNNVWKKIEKTQINRLSRLGIFPPRY